MKLLQNLVGLTTLLSTTTITAALPTSDYNNNHSHNPQSRLSWTLKSTNSTQQFRGLAPVSNKIVWVSGTNATVLRTTNSGSTWTNVSPSLGPGENSSDYEFRDVHAFSAREAVVLGIGEGNKSRIYRTSDAGKTWKRTFLNGDAAAFYDCLAFEEDGSHGLALSDPVNGKFRLHETWNGGKSWKLVDPAGMPPALAGEFAFAASGTCIEAKAGRWYIASGGVDPGRIFSSGDDGLHWSVVNSTIVGGAAAGVFSVRFHDGRHGVAVGGDYEVPTGAGKNAAWSRDGGRTWVGAEKGVGGYRSGVAWAERDLAVAVGTSGSDITVDGGREWKGLGNESFDAVECVSRNGYSGGNGCWASGAKGRVGWLDLEGL
jgi:photosystem II stability/assembly factor-like uncharacterized protein